MTMPSSSLINNHGVGPQNVAAGNGPQYNNNNRGPQFNNSIFYWTDPKDPRAAEAKEKEDCLHSLSYQNIDARKINISSAHPETCDWFFNTTQFQQWCYRTELFNHNGVLWVKGKPGAGKSTLMKHILKHCEKEIFKEHIIAAHFFNARGDSFEQTPLGMLRSLVYQLLENEPSIYDRFIPKFRNKQRRHREWEWKERELEEFLHSETKRSQPKRLLFLIDALDECSESHVRTVVKFLESLSLGAKATLNICLSSRHYPYISMEKRLELVIEATIEHDRDIIKYASDKLINIDEEIKTQVLEKASGVFLWVVLVIEMLNQAYDEGKIEAMHRKLHDVPSDLDEVFRTVLIKDNLDKEETLFMFQFVLFTRRLLSPEELFFAMMAESNVKNRGTWKPSETTQDIIRRRIIHSSRGLIEVTPGGTVAPSIYKAQRTVQFIHESVKDFLIRNKRLRILDPELKSDLISRSHERLRSCCMSYITKEISQPVMDSAQAKALGLEYPFLEYASTYIFVHAEEADRIGQAQFLQLLEEEHATLKRVRLFHNSFHEHTGWECIRVSLLYMLAVHGYNKLAKVLLEKEIDINALGGPHGTALEAAAAEGQEETVVILLEKGADINIQGGKYGTALQAAAALGKEKTVAILLEKGADINAQEGYYGTALQAATANSEKEIVVLLLEKGANINAQGGHYGTALQAAIANSEKEIVVLLLEKGANINAQGGHYGTALQAAVANGKKEIVALLLEKGANININSQEGIYGTALQVAAAEGKEEIMAMLLERGADIDTQGGMYGTALQAAAAFGKEKTIIMLLERGADIDTQGGIYGTALQAAVAKGKKKL